MQHSKHFNEVSVKAVVDIEVVGSQHNAAHVRSDFVVDEGKHRCRIEGLPDSDTKASPSWGCLAFKTQAASSRFARAKSEKRTGRWVNALCLAA